MSRRYTISILVNDQFGVLARVAGLFASRGYNIHSLCVAPTQEKNVSRMTIVTEGTEEIIEQINKQLNKLIDVVKVLELGEINHVDRELVLVKVNATAQTRDEILRLIDIFRGRIIDVSAASYSIEITGNDSKIRGFMELIEPMGLIEVARTGKVAITRGQKGMSEINRSAKPD